MAANPAPAIPTAIVTPFAMPPSMFFMDDSPAVAPSLIAMIGLTTMLPTDFSFEPIVPSTLLAVSFALITGDAIFFPTVLTALLIFVIFALASSFVLMTGDTIFFPTDLTALLTFVIFALASSFALMTGDAASLPNCRIFPSSPSVFAMEDAVSTFAV